MDLYALFAGDKANQMDHQAYFKAKDLDKQGEDPEEIWKKTGWFKGPDNNWRFELDDSKSKLRKQSGTLAEVYQHGGNLYENYPSLLDTIMKYEPRETGNINGSFRYSDGQIDVMPRPGDDPLEILTHELQHAINKRQGWSTGMNASQPGYANNIGEQEARLSANRLKFTPEERKMRFPMKDWK